MLRFSFFVDERRKNDLRLRLIRNRKKVEISLHLSVSPDELRLAQRGISNGVSPAVFRYIRECMSQLEAYCLAIRIVADDKDLATIKIEVQKMLGLLGAEPQGEAIEAKKEDSRKSKLLIPYMLEHGKKKSASTYESICYTASVMRKFDANADQLTFEDLDYSWLTDFELYMINANLSQNTRKIHFGNIRLSIRDAYNRELTENDPFRRFAFRPAKTRKRSLSVEDLRKLFDYSLPYQTEVYRDMFKLIFMLVGINTVDLFRLQRITPDGYIEYDRAKTGRPYRIKVEPEARVLIEKYRGEKGLLMLADRWTSHVNFRKQLNNALRSIGVTRGQGRRRNDASHAEWPELTSYWARHTWATMARKIGVSVDDIALALGHSDRKHETTFIYIDDDEISEAIDKANRRVLDYVLYNKL